MTWVYAGSVSPERRYQLQNAEANQQIDALLERLRVPGESWRLESELVTTALKLFEDGAAISELKIANAALKELRYGFKVFAPYRGVPKVTVFGSARTPADHSIATQARTFGKRMTGIRIVQLDGTPVDFVRGIILRLWVLGFVAGIANQCCLGWVVFLIDVLPIFGQDRRCLHDHIAGTKVVVAP